MQNLIDAVINAALENLAPIAISLVLGLAALGYRRALKRLKALVAETPNKNDDRAFDAFEAELRKRKLLPDGYDEAIAKARQAAKSK